MELLHCAILLAVIIQAQCEVSVSGLQSVEVEPGTDSTWGMVEHEMMNPCPAGNLNLMCGGGLVTSDWTRRVEEERFSHYYNTPLYLEV